MTGNKMGHQFEYRMRKIISIITAVNIMICLTGCGYECYNFAGGYRFYEAVYNDRCLNEQASACGMDQHP